MARTSARRLALEAVAPLMIVSEENLTKATQTLLARDPAVIAALLEACGPPPLRRREAGLAGLTWIVVSQQVSTASARAIYARVEARFSSFDPLELGAASDDDLKACGLSAPKTRTLRALCDAVGSGALDLAGLAAMEPEAARSALVRVKGIGPWSADIYLLFCLGCPDVWPVGDLALQEAARLALGLRTRPDARKLERLGERWRPYRAVAARLLWAYYGVRKSGAKAA